MELERQQRETLSVLGYMYLRMGELDRAGRLFTALLALAEKENPDSRDAPWRDALTRLAHASLAAVEIVRDNPKSALDHLHRAMDGRVLSSRHAALHLLRARALWRQGRKDEAGLAVEAYVHLSGGRTGSRGNQNSVMRESGA